MTLETGRIESGIGRYCGTTAKIIATVRTMHRLARQYSTIQVRWCNEEMTPTTTRSLEAREARLETSITGLAQDLPQPEDPVTHERGQWAVVFEGDPRGHTVALVPIWPGEDPVQARRTSSRWIGVD